VFGDGALGVYLQEHAITDASVASLTADMGLADAKSAELYNADPTRDPWEIMQECAEYARSWLFQYVDNLGGKKQNVREERKQAMDEVTPRNIKSSIGEDEPEHESYSDIIAEMKQARHQAA